VVVKKKEMDYFTALYNVARVINASLEPVRVLEEIVQCVVKATDVKAASIRLLDNREKRLILGGAYGLSDAYLHKGPILIAESGIDKKALKGKTIYIEDAQTDKGFQYGEKAKAEGIKSVLIVPLLIEKKAIGVLRVYSDMVREFQEKELQFLLAVADLSAIAIENARLHQILQVRCDLMTEHKYRIDDN
jgi:signal transduction protein with GAF and PtsI domain